MLYICNILYQSIYGYIKYVILYYINWLMGQFLSMSWQSTYQVWIHIQGWCCIVLSDGGHRKNQCCIGCSQYWYHSMHLFYGCWVVCWNLQVETKTWANSGGWLVSIYRAYADFRALTVFTFQERRIKELTNLQIQLVYTRPLMWDSPILSLQSLDGNLILPV